MPTITKTAKRSTKTKDFIKKDFVSKQLAIFSLKILRLKDYRSSDAVKLLAQYIEPQEAQETLVIKLRLLARVFLTEKILNCTENDILLSAISNPDKEIYSTICKAVDNLATQMSRFAIKYVQEKKDSIIPPNDNINNCNNDLNNANFPSDNNSNNNLSSMADDILKKERFTNQRRFIQISSLHRHGHIFSSKILYKPNYQDSQPVRLIAQYIETLQNKEKPVINLSTLAVDFIEQEMKCNILFLAENPANKAEFYNMYDAHHYMNRKITFFCKKYSEKEDAIILYDANNHSFYVKQTNTTNMSIEKNHDSLNNANQQDRTTDESNNFSLNQLRKRKSSHAEEKQTAATFILTSMPKSFLKSPLHTDSDSDLTSAESPSFELSPSKYSKQMI